MKLIALLICLSFVSISHAEIPTLRRDRIEYFFNQTSFETMDIVDKFYAENVLFEDPLGSMRGRKKLKAYYSNLYKNVTSIKFTFLKHIVEGEEHTAIWRMKLQAKNLNDNKPISLDGISHIRFDPKTNLVTYHKDYFDMGAFIYEHIPILGWGVRKVKERLSHEDK